MKIQTAWTLSILLLLSGCSDLLTRETPAPVISLQQSFKKGASIHKVRKGETLYEIAWGYGLDYRDLARFNQLIPPFTIHPGQRLYLNQTTMIKKPAYKTSKNVGAWAWPVRGRIVKSYSEHEGNINKGIDIAGSLGSLILATQSGKVVYAGEGLRGYGKLIIIKHSDDFLSAYAHNQAILVQEGTEVQSGQPIAKMGKTGTDEIKLHFEIRQNGKPADPLKFLPSF